MNVLVTGGCGFIGSDRVKYLGPTGYFTETVGMDVVVTRCSING